MILKNIRNLGKIKLSYRSSKVQYFATKNSQYYTFFPKLKLSLAKIVNFGFSVQKIKTNLKFYRISAGISTFRT